MRLGVLTRGEIVQLKWAKRLGFRSIAWMAFDRSQAATAEGRGWRPYVEELADAARELDLRISAIGAYYRNPLDPRQTELARKVLHRAIDVAAYLGTLTVSCFAGAIIETELNERGGNLVYRPLEDYLPQVLGFWEPLARYAADRGVRIAFENCPQGYLRLPVMSSNFMGRPALWERLFNATTCANIGLEWDPSHLICQLVDPIANLRKFAARIFHVHAKDAWVDERLMREYGICHPGVTEYRMPGFGQANWAEILHTLVRVGYDSDVNVEGHQDPVFRDGAEDLRHPSLREKRAGKSPRLEEAGLLVAKQTLERYVTGTE
jgi:sugar phosphate isomerase/epimerase